MAMVRTLVRLSPPVSCELEVLGHSFDVATSEGLARLELPSYEWRDDRLQVVAPRSAGIGASHFGDHFFVDSDSHISWGDSHHSRLSDRSGSALVAAVLASIEVDDSAIERSEYLHGVGAPEGSAIRDLRNALDAWRTNFVEWVSLLAGQAVSSETPPIPSRARIEAEGTVVWVELDNAVVGLPSYQSNRVTVIVEDPSEVHGFTLDNSLLERVLKLVATGAEPSTQLRLLRSARVAIRRNERRLAVMELGSAAEICLWELFDSTVRESTPRERERWTLGVLVKEVFGSQDPRRTALETNLVAPRNDAVHRAKECDRETAMEAFALVRQLVSDELPEPLPGVSGTSD